MPINSEFPKNNCQSTVKGYRDALIALKEVSKGKFLAVIYKEISKEDGFIITAYFTSKINLEKEVILWQRM